MSYNLTPGTRARIAAAQEVHQDILDEIKRTLRDRSVELSYDRQQTIHNDCSSSVRSSSVASVLCDAIAYAQAYTQKYYWDSDCPDNDQIDDFEPIEFVKLLNPSTND